MGNLLSGFALVFQPLTFALLVFGTAMGVVIGALPGLTASMGIILLLPLVYRLPANVSLVMLCGLFCGGMFGGSISAILLKTPGTPSASATVLDGYPLCEQGKAGKALGIATVSSFIGGIISTICLILIAPQLAKVALKFQAADYFSLAIFGLSIMASSSGKNVVKGLIAGCIGLLASCIGIDTIVGVNRLTFNNMYLAGGFSLLPVLIGVFAISEVLTQVQEKSEMGKIMAQTVRNILPSWIDVKLILPTAIVGSILGVFIGIVPGTGARCSLSLLMMPKGSTGRIGSSTSSLICSAMVVHWSRTGRRVRENSVAAGSPGSSCPRSTSPQPAASRSCRSGMVNRIARVPDSAS